MKKLQTLNFKHSCAGDQVLNFRRVFMDLRTVKAAPCCKDYDRVFLETVALPEEIVTSPYLYNYMRFARAFAQWRVDFPKTSLPKLSDKERIVVAVLEKIITRGRFTMASPFLENDFRKTFLGSERLNVYVLKSAVGVASFPMQGFGFDSREEERFYLQIAPQLFGEDFSWFVHPQIGLDTLTRDRRFKDQKVDFIITHPSHKTPVVVEIDGPHHSKTTVHDKERDDALKRNGYEVVRIKPHELGRLIPEPLGKMSKTISTIKSQTNEEDLKFLYALKTAHQVQTVLMLALKNGMLRLSNLSDFQVVSDIHELGLFSIEESLYILEKAVSDFANLLKNIIQTIFGEKIEANIKFSLASQDFHPTEHNIFVSFSGKSTLGIPTFHVRNVYLPFHFSFSPFSSPDYRLQRRPSEKELEFFLKYIFRKESFWEGQYEGITRVLQGKDTLVLLPTGGGKSLIYQLSSMLLPGVTFVVDPLISLMDDQVYNLRAMGIDRALALHSNLRSKEKHFLQQCVGEGNYLFVFISPERLRIEDFREIIPLMLSNYPTSMVVIDEVHCVSEWGHDFRPSYLSVAKFSRSIFSSKDSPPILGLTGTASNVVLKDVMRILEIGNETLITPQSFDRKELEYHVIKCDSSEKRSRLIKILKEVLPNKFKISTEKFFKPNGDKTYSGIVFCPFVNGNHGVNEIKNFIEKEGIRTVMYSGSPPNGVSEERYRKEKEESMIKFKQNRVPVMVATKSFGMGIDKPNIRYTIHYNAPQSIEQFYQEAGRAGRDKKKAYALLLLHLEEDWKNRLEDSDRPRKGSWQRKKDDLNNLLWFHNKSFKGQNAELKIMETVLEELGDITKEKEHEFSVKKLAEKIGNIMLKIPEDEWLKDFEKAVYHLSKLGIVKDYLVNHKAMSIKVRLSGAGKDEVISSYINYVKSYLPGREQAELKKISGFNNDSISLEDFAKKMAQLLVKFVYETIERQKRRMMREMLIAAYDSKNGEDFRKRIIDYLETTEYTEDIKTMLENVHAIRAICEKIITDVLRPKDAHRLRGQVARYLESYPDHPGLLILRSLSEFLVEPSNTKLILQDLRNAIVYSLEDYNFDPETVADITAWAISRIRNKENKHEVAKFLIDLTDSMEDEEFLIALTQYLSKDFKWIPSWKVLELLYSKAQKIAKMEVGV